ncbi:MAG: SusC/RagA family TonB-linked outer membrane protein, partial [Pedobacter sp.]
TGQPGSNPYLFPANDWREIMFKDNTLNQRANLNISGGGGVARYFVSGSLNKDNGILNVDKRNNFNTNIDLKSYTLRSNVDIDVTKTTMLTVRLSGNFDDYTGPITGGADMYKMVMRSNPVLFPAYYPVDEDHKFVKHIMFGNASRGLTPGADYLNPYAEMTKGYKESSRSLMLAQLEIKQDLKMITEGLSFNAMMNTNRTSYFDVSRFYNPYYYGLGGYDVFSDQYRVNVLNEQSATEYLGYSEGPKQLSSVFYLQSILNYARNFKKHGLSGMLVYMMQQNLSANAGNLQLSLPFRNLGLSGRATYNYDGRYFAEFNFGYNGSERFYEDKRFGFFPSAGVAWSISNEKFFESIKPVISSLRLRATYGLIGNDAIGSPSDRFFYLSNVNMNAGNRAAFFGRGDGATNSLSGVSVSRYSNPDITWETAKKQNYALELSLFEAFNLRAEYFSEKRENILMTRESIPTTMGFSAPIRANVGEASGRGADISFDYQKNFSNGLWLSGLGNFTYAVSKYEVFEEPTYKESYRTRVGSAISQNFGYIAERLFIDDEEAANSPMQSFGQYGGGDIKFTDVNGDGKITTADMVPIGNPITPEVTYGFGISGGFKGFDASVFFQGLANESFWMDPAATSPFAPYRYDGEAVRGVVSNQVLKAYADSYWSEDRQDVTALWPRLSTTVNANNAQPSTWFMRDGSFLRLKQVEVGYALPVNVQKRLGTGNFRIYANASNLFTFSKFKLWDVEMGGNGLGYPVQRVFNLGVNVSF